MKEWYNFYKYENNKDLIIKLCKKFRLNEPSERMNKYGIVDLVFIVGLKTYLITIDDYNELFIIKRRNTLNVGQKLNKEYMNEIKRLHSGNIWYESLKFISQDANL